MCLPFDANKGQGEHFLDALRQLKQFGPPQPSTGIASDRKGSALNVRNHQTAMRDLASSLGNAIAPNAQRPLAFFAEFFLSFLLVKLVGALE